MSLSILDTDIHHWFADLDQFVEPDELSCFQSSLGCEEQSRLQRFRSSRKKRQFLISHGLLRRILSVYLGREPGFWSFEIGEYGKPVLSHEQNELGLVFNLSHSQSRLAIVISRQGQLGVDVEYSSRKREIIRLAHRYFSAAEVAELASCADADREDYFYRYWTLKEAYIKARGKGLAIPLRDFSYSIRPQRPLSLQESATEYQGGIWNLWSLQHGTDYHGAIAWWTKEAISAPILSCWNYGPDDQISAGASPVLQQSGSG